MQYHHHRCATHTFRVVQPGLGKATLLELGHPLVGIEQHVFTSTEAQCACGTGLDARRLQPDRQAVGTHGALVGLVVLGVDFRDIERTGTGAVTATNTLV